jgi:type IV pilus assembly protein PilY1
MTEPNRRFSHSSSSAGTLRRVVRRASCTAALMLSAAYAPYAAAQADVAPQNPNVLLLVDTSGSMEYKTSSNSFPLCRYDANGVINGAPATSEKSRWTDLVEVLTGSITDYQCQTLDRGSASFKNEYKIAVGSTLGANSPYDFLYANPYHRPLSNGCAPGPGALSTANPAQFLTNAFNYHLYNNVNAACGFGQSPDGILDAFQDGVRFGLMTFDTDPSPDSGELGTYSYIASGTSSHAGKPTGCTTFSQMEVGARNASAPPWEGRLIPFGNPEPGNLDYKTKNTQIQQVLRATRPYGATPIAGMLSDARDFLWNDNSLDPVDTTQRFGPNQDPYGACRKSVVLLLSDGQPNMDLRGHCTGSDCPFQLPEDIAHDLLVPSGHTATNTYVVGFALKTLTVDSTSIDCSALKPSDLDATPSALCAAHPDNPALQACCNLARIAIAGDDAPGRHAYFADNPEELRSSISQILGKSQSPTSRTQPAFSGVAGSAQSTLAPAASYRFFSSFTPVSFQPWSGQVTRERWVCDKDTHIASAAPVNSTLGDLFADNVNSRQGRQRTFYTVLATDTGSGINSANSIRPNLGSNPDGVGATAGTLISGADSAFVSNTTPASMGLTDTSCTTTVGTVITPMTAAQCRDKYLKWLVGVPGGNGTVFNRCPATGQCNLVGDIYHATPQVVNAPRDLTRDDSYQAFQSLYATRPLMLYTSSNDGMLHGFKVASNVKTDTELVDTKKNNELWAFIPPEVLPFIARGYPYTHQLLLDGVSVIKDVVARKTSGSYPYVLERSTTDAQAGASTNVTWRTILVQGFGGTFPGYFALDVTNPDPQMTVNGEAGGPKFLWQLTADDSGKPLFGAGGATPTITTLLVDEDGSGAREVPVAILPGGNSGGAGTDGGNNPKGCKRASSTSDLSTTKFSGYAPRGYVPCYTDNIGSRSLTVVRLDTGKIIRTFRRAVTEVPAAVQPSVLIAPLDSPITGQPVAYPSDVGSVADRIFVGDQDGSLWKVDVSNKSPANWKMSLFWDAYGGGDGNPAGDWNSGQPIATPPVLSVDSVGNLTVALSTGDQSSLGTSTGQTNFIWSLRDLPDSSHVFSASLAWGLKFLDGERVTGPISLFNSYLYFSTVTPPPANAACTSTNGARIWGMHYLTPRDGDGTPATPPVRTVGGKPAPFLATLGSTTQYVTDTSLLGTSASKQAVIFGVTVAQVPTCYSEDTIPDGLGNTTSRISNVNPGRFQLLIQTGAASVGTGGQAQAAGATSGLSAGAAAISLPSLATPARIEGWAALVE